MKLRILSLLPILAIVPLTGCNTTQEAPEERVTAESTDYPTAKPAPDEGGKVFSPFTSEPHYVDVTGLKSGTLVKCPWTEKLFYVP